MRYISWFDELLTNLEKEIIEKNEKIYSSMSTLNDSVLLSKEFLSMHFSECFAQDLGIIRNLLNNMETFPKRHSCIILRCTTEQVIQYKYLIKHSLEVGNNDIIGEYWLGDTYCENIESLDIEKWDNALKNKPIKNLIESFKKLEKHPLDIKNKSISIHTMAEYINEINAIENKKFALYNIFIILSQLVHRGYKLSLNVPDNNGKDIELISDVLLSSFINELKDSFLETYRMVVKKL